MLKFVLAVTLSCSTLHAYSLYDGRPHWRQDIKYYCEDLYCDVVASAAHEWQTVLGNTITFVQTDDPFAANCVVCTGSGVSGGTIAYASCSTGDDVIYFALVQVFQPLLMDKAVAMHELGHVLGLDHSSDFAAVMYPLVYSTKISLGVDDIKAIFDLYEISAITEIPVSVHWVKGRYFMFESFTGAVVQYGKNTFTIDHLSQKIMGRLPLQMTITYDGVEKTFTVLKPNKRKPETIRYDY